MATAAEVAALRARLRQQQDLIDSLQEAQGGESDTRSVFAEGTGDGEWTAYTLCECACESGGVSEAPISTKRFAQDLRLPGG